MTDKKREEYIEEKAKELHHELFGEQDEEDFVHGAAFHDIKDFIRTLLNEMKPKVSKEFIQKTMTYITAFPSQRRLIRVLIDAGVEVEE